MKEEEIRNICTAAAGLYGIIHVRQLSEVLAYVGETNHPRRRLLGLLEESVPANCCLKEGFLYCDHVFERWADWERILERSARKPHCLLPLEELLPYADHEYIEWTPAAEELLSPMADKSRYTGHLIDFNVRAERMGWLPSAPQLGTNPLTIAREAEKAGMKLSRTRRIISSISSSL